MRQKNAFPSTLITIAAIAVSAVVLVPLAAAQAAAVKETTCVFADGSGMRIQYTPEPHPLKDGRVWTPGDRPVVLFLDGPVSLDGVPLRIGAYGVYFVRKKDEWTLIISRDAKPGSEYARKGDLVRAKMGSAEFSQKLEHPQIALVHPAPSQCNLRLYAASTMAWGEFQQGAPGSTADGK